MTIPKRLRPAYRFIEQPSVAALIIFLNAVGFVWGMVFWYGDHFLHGKPGMDAPSPLLWPFIPDCPLFAGLFILAFLAVRRYKSQLPAGWRLFSTITAFGLIKYGVWTDTFWIANWSRGGPVEFMGVLLFMSHMGMIIEGLYLLDFIRLTRRDVAIAFTWFLLSDFVDYGLGEYPLFFGYQAPFGLMKWHTIAMTFILGGWFWWLAGRRSGATDAVTETQSQPAAEVAPASSSRSE